MRIYLESDMSRNTRRILFLFTLLMLSTYLVQNWCTKKDLTYLRTSTFDGSKVKPALEQTASGRITLNEIEPRSESFFLVETSGRSSLDPKELCTIESVAKHHPNNTVYVLLTSPFADSAVSFIADKYSNVEFRGISVESFLVNSPLAELWTSGKLRNSDYLVSHLSDVLRYLVLYKYGGTYLDMDQVVIKTFPDLPNFIGRESFWIGKEIIYFGRGNNANEGVFFIKQQEEFFA